MIFFHLETKQGLGVGLPLIPFFLQNVLFTNEAPSYRVTVKHSGADGYSFDHVHINQANGGVVRCDPSISPETIDNKETALLSCVVVS